MHGFTLLELLVVMVVIAIALAVVLPRFSSVSTQNLNSDTAKVKSLVSYLHEASESKKLFYRLIFNINNRTLSVEKSKDSVKYVKEREKQISGLRLSQGVDILSISAPGLGTKISGTVEILLSPTGGSQPFTLRLGNDKRVLAVIFNPYNGRVSIEEEGL